MAHVREVTIWARGVVQDKEGRDVSQIIAFGADREGKLLRHLTTMRICLTGLGSLCASTPVLATKRS